MSFIRPAACVLVVLLLLAAGCQPKGDPLRATAKALEQEDYDQAVVLANESLEDSGTGPKAAEALYMRGRAYEQRTAKTNVQLAANLQAARTSYVAALQHNPSRTLTTYIRASLGKVAFFQDDFATAVQQLTIAHDELKDRDLKAASLFYLGKSQQRSGQFAQADQTLGNVISNYGDTGWAQKAKEVRGAKAFYLQLAVYEKQESLEPAAKLVQQRGLNPVRLKDDQNRFLLRAGPYSTYAQAKQLKPRLADAFPDALIVP